MALLCNDCGVALNPDASRFGNRSLNAPAASVCQDCFKVSPLYAECEDKLRALDVYHPRKGYVFPIWSDSRVWMDLATANHEFPEPNGTWNEVSKNNIALTCAGMALETVYKALLLADGRSQYCGGKQPYSQDMPYSHSIKVLHGRLRKDRKVTLGTVITSVYKDGGGSTSTLDRYFEDMDEYVNHPYRRYWFMGASTGGGLGGALQSICAVHQTLMKLVENAWSELQSEYSAAADAWRELMDRTPDVYDSYHSSLSKSE